MKIYVTDSKAQQCPIEGINPGTLVKDLKKKVIEKNRITTGNIQLIFSADILQDEETLEYYDIQEGNNITYVGEFPAGLKRKKKKICNIFI